MVKKVELVPKNPTLWPGRGYRIFTTMPIERTSREKVYCLLKLVSKIFLPNVEVNYAFQFIRRKLLKKSNTEYLKLYVDIRECLSAH